MMYTDEYVAGVVIAGAATADGSISAQDSRDLSRLAVKTNFEVRARLGSELTVFHEDGRVTHEPFVDHSND